MPHEICHKLITLIFSGVSLTTTCGCSLIYEYDRCSDEFIVRSDWEYAPDANPESMAYMFFSTTTPDCWRYDFSGREGGEVELPDGSYQVLTLNDDSGVIRITDSSCGFSHMKVNTVPSRLYASLGGGPDSLGHEAVASCPTQLWCSNVEIMRLSDDGVRWNVSESSGSQFCPNRIFTVYPRATMATYTYEITDVENLDGVSRMCSALSGMASELTLCNVSKGGKAVTLPLKANMVGESSVGGSFLTMGIPDNKEPENCLWFYVWLTDGRRFSYSFDVTRQIRNAPDPMHVHIKVGGISLPESKPADKGAFDVAVDGWIESIINIAG